VLDAVRSELPACEVAEGGFTLPFPEGGCWSVETVELPGGAQRQATFIAANTRTELEAAIEKHAKPKLQPEQEIGVGESESGRGVLTQSFYRTYLLRSKTELTGDYIVDARAAVDSSQAGGQKPVVVFTMSAEGARLMEKLTSENLGRRMATVLDAKVETAPYIQGRISTNGQITLGSGRDYQAMYEEANEIALVLKAGALPAPVTIFEERTVGATLGPELIKSGTTAALVGLVLVLIFMVVYYRMSGLIADAALALNGVLVLAIMAMLGSTLTLPGIAGFVLTIGAAVDANVLINERIREERKRGRRVIAAVENGYKEASRAIFDANITNFIAGVLLFMFGTGPVRGFAVVLIIGLFTSVFTAVSLTRMWVAGWLRRARPQDIHL
jgi:preprotein translocase subunit SecD